MDKYEDALDSVTWYNGLWEIVQTWKDLPTFGTYGLISAPMDYGAGENKEWVKNQLQVLWMIAVMLFGDYGTSPRYGWIEKVDEFKEWVDTITKAGRECEDDEA